MLKTIKDSFVSAPYDASLASKYKQVSASTTVSTTTTTTTSTSEAKSTESVPAGGNEVNVGFSIDDLVNPVDISGELPPLLKLLNATEGKESWKSRQQGLSDIITLLKQKKRVINNKAISDLVFALKNRLNESHLMLKAKVLQCFGQLVEAIGDECLHYNGTVMSEIIKLTSESNKTVVDSLYNMLSLWVSHSPKSQSACFNSLCCFFPAAFKNVKGRKAFLSWLNQYVMMIEKRGAMYVLPGCIECVLDKTKDVRNEAITAIKMMAPKIGRIAIEEEIQKQKNSDKMALQSSLKSILESTADYGIATSGEASLPVFKESSNAANAANSSNGSNGGVNEGDADKKEDKSVLTEARRQALANRPGARVLTKRTESIASTLKRQAVSSIPKPQPPLKKRARQPFGNQEGIQGNIQESIQENIQENDQQEMLIEEKPVEMKEEEAIKMIPPSMNLIAFHPSVVDSNGSSLLSQKELQQCLPRSIQSPLPSPSFATSLLLSLSQLQHALNTHPNVILLSQQLQSEYNSFIEITTQFCWIVNNVIIC